MCGGTDWQGEGPSTKVTFECPSHHYTSPYSKEKEEERERHGRACKRLMRDRERVLESRVSTAFLGNSESQNLRKGKGIILNDMPI